MYSMMRADATSLDFRALVNDLDGDLKLRDGDDHDFYHQFNAIAPLKHVIVCYVDGQAIGCGAFKAFDANTVEIKRMYIQPAYRRQGWARKILNQLENWAAEVGYSYAVLETGKAQPEAIALYESCDYTVIPNFGQYIGVDNSLCFKKELTQ